MNDTVLVVGVIVVASVVAWSRVEPVQPAQWSRCSLMKREAHSMASSFDLTSYSA